MKVVKELWLFKVAQILIEKTVVGTRPFISC